MRRRGLVALALVAAGLGGADAARAALACSMTAQPGKLAGSYAASSNLDLQGSFVLNCTRALLDPTTFTLWIGVYQTAGRTLVKPAPHPDTLSYGIYRDAARSNLWTAGAAATSGAGALAVTLDFGLFNLGTAATLTLPVYLRVTAGQPDKAAGTYSDNLAVEVRLGSNTGAVLSSTPQSGEASIPKHCSLALSGGAYAVEYASFRPTALVDSSRSAVVTCSKGTQYQLQLDRTTGVIPGVELTYSLVFSSSGGATAISTSSTSTASQSFGLTLTLPAGQAGKCPGAVCSGSANRQLTISY